MAVDVATLGVISQVVVSSTTGPFALRPQASGPENEAWVAGTAVSVVDLSKQTLLASIPTPSIPQAHATAGIGFTKDGATAFEAVRYFSPDSLGNNGALVIFDAVKRAVTSTVPLKIGPAAMAMAPDGMTAYLLSQSGQLTYYDVLSGTADLTVSTYPPGMNGGYSGSGPVFIHPDGTRLFWNVNYLLEEFDLTTRKITTFDSGLPSTSGSTFTMSQDGAFVYFSNAVGDVVIMDTQDGLIRATYNTGSSTTVLGGPAPEPNLP